MKVVFVDEVRVMKLGKVLASIIVAAALVVAAAAVLPSVSFAHDHHHGHHGSPAVSGTAGHSDARKAAALGSISNAFLHLAELKRPTRQTKMMSGLHRHCSDCPDEPAFAGAILSQRAAFDFGAAVLKAPIIFALASLDGISGEPGSGATKPPWLFLGASRPRHVLITTARLRI